MAKKGVPITKLIGVVTETLTDKNVQKALFGTYSDGSSRSLVDCVNGEFLSPKDREKYVYKKKKKGKKKKKNKIKL